METKQYKPGIVDMRQPYDAGVLDGRLMVYVEFHGSNALMQPPARIVAAQRNARVVCDDNGDALAPEAESSYWLGYYHGRANA